MVTIRKQKYKSLIINTIIFNGHFGINIIPKELHVCRKRNVCSDVRLLRSRMFAELLIFYKRLNPSGSPDKQRPYEKCGNLKCTLKTLNPKQITKSTNHQITKSTNHQITKSPNHQITKSPNHQFQKNYVPLHLNKIELVEFNYERIRAR